MDPALFHHREILKNDFGCLNVFSIFLNTKPLFAMLLCTIECIG